MDPAIKALIDAINSLKSSIEGEASSPTSFGLTSDDLRERQDAVGDLINEHKELAKTEENQIKIGQKNIEIAEAQTAQLETELELRKQKKDLSKEEFKQLRREISQSKKNTATLVKEAVAREEQNEKIEETIAGLGGFIDVSKKANKSIRETISNLKNNTAAQKELGDRLTKNYSKSKIAMNAFKKVMPFVNVQVAQAFNEVQSGVASFNQATGMADMFGQKIADSSKKLRHLGVTTTDIGVAMNALGQVIPLHELGDATKYAEKFALYEKFGISAQASASAFENLTRSLGRTNEESMHSISNIGELGRQLGVGAGRLVEDFSQALPRLAIYGNDAEKIFRNVATASAKMGLGVEDILSLSEGLQTFESSAQAAGKLNAILGGGFIDNLELMEAAFEDPAKAAGMIKSAFADAGMSVESMGPAALKASATAAGFSDVNKFRKFLEGDASALESREDTQKKLQLDANNIAKKSQTTLQQISDALTGKTQEFMGNLPMDIQNMSNAAGPGSLAAAGAVGLFGGTALNALGGLGKRGIGKFLTGKGSKKNIPAPIDFGDPKKPKKPGRLGKMFGKIKMPKIPKLGGKALGTVLKKVPGIGALMGIGFMASRLADGDILGAGMELTSGLASTIPGAGTAASLGIDAALMARDMNAPQVDSSMPKGGARQKPTTTASKSVVEHKHVVEIVQNTPNAERFVKAIYREDLSSVT